MKYSIKSCAAVFMLLLISGTTIVSSDITSSTGKLHDQMCIRDSCGRYSVPAHNAYPDYAQRHDVRLESGSQCACILSDGDFGVPGLGGNLPVCKGPGSYRAGNGLYERGGISGHPGLPQDFQAYHAQRDPAHYRYGYAGYRRYHYNGIHYVFPWRGRFAAYGKLGADGIGRQ